MSKKKKTSQDGGSTSHVESKKKKTSQDGGSTSHVDFKGRKLDIKSIMKDIESISSPHTTWREKKDLEDKKIVSLGGKAPKKQRLPLSVARVVMKKQKERDQKMLQENMILSRFRGGLGIGNSGSKKTAEKRKVEDKVLRSTEGNFRNGILDVKHLLKSSGPSSSSAPKDSGSNAAFSKGKKKGGGGKKNKGKKKGGGGKKRH